MDHLEEIESYASAFAEEIRRRFDADIAAAAEGLAQVHGQDSESCEATLWEAVITALGGEEPDPYEGFCKFN